MQVLRACFIAALGSIALALWVRGELKIRPGLSEFAAQVNDLNDRGDAVGGSVAGYADHNYRAVLWPGGAKQPPSRVDR
jgi:hypothetical protein